VKLLLELEEITPVFYTYGNPRSLLLPSIKDEYNSRDQIFDTFSSSAFIYYTFNIDSKLDRSVKGAASGNVRYYSNTTGSVPRPGRVSSAQPGKF